MTQHSISQVSSCVLPPSSSLSDPNKVASKTAKASQPPWCTGARACLSHGPAIIGNNARHLHADPLRRISLSLSLSRARFNGLAARVAFRVCCAQAAAPSRLSYLSLDKPPQKSKWLHTARNYQWVHYRVPVPRVPHLICQGSL